MYVPVPLGLFDVATDQDTCTRVLYIRMYNKNVRLGSFLLGY